MKASHLNNRRAIVHDSIDPSELLKCLQIQFYLASNLESNYKTAELDRHISNISVFLLVSNQCFEYFMSQSRHAGSGSLSSSVRPKSC